MADPLLTGALAQDGAWLFGAVRIDLTGIGTMTGPLCLLDGAATVSINGEAYAGEDETYGALDTIDALTENEGDEAPEVRLSLNVPDASAAAQLASPLMQGREVRIVVGAVDPATGTPIGQPEVKFLGEIDVPTLNSSLGERSVEYVIVSVFERLFEVEDGCRATDGWHQSIHPGELGLEYMTGTDKNLYWGTVGPAQSTGMTGVKGWSASAQTIRDNWIANR